MSEFENTIPQNGENPDSTQDEATINTASEKIIETADDENTQNTSPEESVAQEAPLEDSSPDTPKNPLGAIPVKKLIKPLIALAVIIILIFVLKSAFSRPQKGDETLFTDNMLVFTEINIENKLEMYGIADKKGKLICDADFSSAYIVGEDIFAAQKLPANNAINTKGSGNYGIINSKGTEITKFSFGALGERFSDGLLPASEGGKWGYIDTKGNWVIKPRYDGTTVFSEKLGGFKDPQSRKWGFVDTKGKVVIKAQFEDIGEFKDGIAPAKDNGKWGFVDTKGEWVIENNFKDIAPFQEKMARAQDTTGDWGYINKKGEWIIKARYQELRDFSDSLAAAKKNGKWGFITKKGEWKINNEFSAVGNFKGGLAFAQDKENGKFGYINKRGKWKIKPVYDVDHDFSLSLACVQLNGKYGYISKGGKTKIPFEYKYALPFYADGYAPVCTGKKSTSDEDVWFVINKSGKAVFEERFDGIYK